MKKVIVLYLLGTFAAAFVAVLVNYIFPITITLTGKAAEGSSPNGIGEVISNLLLKIVRQPGQRLAASQLHWDPFLGNCLWDRYERGE